MEEVIGFSQTRALAANMVGVAALLVLCPTAAIISERVGTKPFLVGPALGTAVLAVPIFLLLQGSYAAVLVAHVCVGRLIGLFGGAYVAAFSELFPTEVRYSSLSLGYSVSVSIFEGVRALDLYVPPPAHRQPHRPRLLHPGRRHPLRPRHPHHRRDRRQTAGGDVRSSRPTRP